MFSAVRLGGLPFYVGFNYKLELFLKIEISMVKQLVIWYNNPENEIVRVNDLDLDIICNMKIRKYLRSVSMAKQLNCRQI